MPRQKLTSASVGTLPRPASGQTLVWDEDLVGFGVRLTPSRGTFIVQSRVNGRSRRVALGTVDAMTVQVARKRARIALGEMMQGRDINADRAAAKARSISLADAFADYMEARPLKGRTREQYEAALRVHLSDWADKEVAALTPAMIEARHKRITKERGESAANATMRVLRAVVNRARASTAGPDGVAVLPANPVHRLSALKAWNRQEARDGVLPPHLFPAFFAGLDAMRDTLHGAAFADYAELLLRSGLRRNEAANLAWADVNATAGTFCIPDPKNGKAHVLPCPPKVAAIFDRRREAAAGDFVFRPANAGAARFDPRKSLLRLRADLGLAITLHDFRRTFAVIADGCDLPYSTLKALMNHTVRGGDVTLQYVVRSPERLRAPMQRISDEIDRLADAKAGDNNCGPVNHPT